MAPPLTMSVRQRIIRGVLWLHARRKRVNAWIVRAVSFYFGYRILRYEIFDKANADPLLIFLGLWLCGVAPASFFDGVRRVGSVTDEIQIPDATPEPPKPELKSGDTQ